MFGFQTHTYSGHNSGLIGHLLTTWFSWLGCYLWKSSPALTNQAQQQLILTASPPPMKQDVTLLVVVYDNSQYIYQARAQKRKVWSIIVSNDKIAFKNSNLTFFRLFFYNISASTIFNDTFKFVLTKIKTGKNHNRHDNI